MVEAKKAKSGTKQWKKRKETDQREKVTVNFTEDGDEILFEVEGQLTDFQSETEQTKMDDTNSENEEDDMDSEIVFNTGNENTNALNLTNQKKGHSVQCCVMERSTAQGHIEEGEEVNILPRDEDKYQKKEEEGMQRFVDYMERQGLVIMDTSKATREESGQFNKTKGAAQECSTNRKQPDPVGEENESTVTIYWNVVNKAALNSEHKKKQISSSSEEKAMDTSDESVGLNGLQLNAFLQQPNVEQNVLNFIAENRARMSRKGVEDQSRQGPLFQLTQRQVGESSNVAVRFNEAENMVRDAERAKARIYDVTGEETQNVYQAANSLTPIPAMGHLNRMTYQSTLLDEDYLLVRNYVDEATRVKIGNGEYVDFSKLMPRDKIQAEEDMRMEMVNGEVSHFGCL